MHVENHNSVNHALKYSDMVTDNAEGEQETEILGGRLVTVPGTYLEKNNEETHGTSNSETLAVGADFNVSCGLTRDIQKNQEAEIRKWKKIDKAVKQNKLTQGCSSEERSEVVGKKRRLGAKQKEGNTAGRKKKTKGQHNDQSCTTVEANV